MALSNSPSGADPHNPGNPNLNAVPASQRESVNNRALAIQSAVIGGEAFTPTQITKAGPLVPAGRDAAGKMLPWVRSMMTSQEGPSLARQAVSGAASGAKSALTWAKSNPIAAMMLEGAAHEMGLDPIQLVRKVIKFGSRGKKTHVP